jgi:hypothetical protein
MRGFACIPIPPPRVIGLALNEAQGQVYNISRFYSLSLLALILRCLRRLVAGCIADVSKELPLFSVSK